MAASIKHKYYAKNTINCYLKHQVPSLFVAPLVVYMGTAQEVIFQKNPAPYHSASFAIPYDDNKCHVV